MLRPSLIDSFPGGNGISSAASVFTELAAAAAVITPGLPCLLVWASRDSDELQVMAPLVLAMAQALQLQLTVKLFYTGERTMFALFAPLWTPPKNPSVSSHRQTRC